jgi:hypothetical protein
MEGRSALDRILAKMGGTGEEVAATLKASGVRGIRNAARFLNPVVRYVQSRIRVDALGLDVMQGDKIRLTYGNGKKEDAPIPHAVRVFLDAFNRGKYPELELPPDEA